MDIQTTQNPRKAYKPRQKKEEPQPSIETLAHVFTSNQDQYNQTKDY